MQNAAAASPSYCLVQLDSLPALPCPCGFARRAFAEVPNVVASLHLVEIEQDSRRHYHRRMTEVYVVLEGEGQIELDGALFPLRRLTAVYIPPGCRHRALGRLRILNVPIPAFDPADEWYD